MEEAFGWCTGNTSGSVILDQNCSVRAFTLGLTNPKSQGTQSVIAQKKILEQIVDEFIGPAPECQ
jgi:hypothetical protein